MHAPDVFFYVAAVKEKRLVRKIAQSGMENSPVFGFVYLFAAEHRGDPLFQARLFRKTEQSQHDFPVNEVFRVIQINIIERS